MISNNEQRCPVKTSFMQITTSKASKTNFMLFTKLNSTMTETENKSKWWKILKWWSIGGSDRKSGKLLHSLFSELRLLDILYQ